MARAYKTPQGSGYSEGRAAVHQVSLNETSGRSDKTGQKQDFFMQRAMVVWSWLPWEAVEGDSPGRFRERVEKFPESRSMHRL